MQRASAMIMRARSLVSVGNSARTSDACCSICPTFLSSSSLSMPPPQSPPAATVQESRGHRSRQVATVGVGTRRQGVARTSPLNNQITGLGGRQRPARWSSITLGQRIAPLAENSASRTRSTRWAYCARCPNGTRAQQSRWRGPKRGTYSAATSGLISTCRLPTHFVSGYVAALGRPFVAYRLWLGWINSAFFNRPQTCSGERLLRRD